MQSQTAGIAVTYFDRCMLKSSEQNDSLELDALACILLASKFMETKQPALSELCSISQNEYTRCELKAAEIDVLKRLEWKLHVTTPHAFLEQMVVALNVPDLCCQRAEFFIDMSYYEQAILEFTPITVAAK